MKRLTLFLALGALLALAATFGRHTATLSSGVGQDAAYVVDGVLGEEAQQQDRKRMLALEDRIHEAVRTGDKAEEARLRKEVADHLNRAFRESR